MGTADGGVLVGETVIGLLHPGEMGAAVGGCLGRRGHRVLWVPAGRSAATAGRAAAAGLEAADSVAGLAAAADVIVSVCPPHAALPTARAVAAAGRFPGIYLDANAIAPGTAREVRAVTAVTGASYVDGGIIGSPPDPAAPGRSRLYLSGERAGEVRALFAGTALDTRVIDGPPEAASAVKMAYAGWTKGSAALLLAVRALARAEGVEEALLAEWALSQPGLPARYDAALRSAAAKGWRWTGEMEEIAASMTADGLPGGFHQAAATVFSRIARGDDALAPRTT
jgi:3-hydroxyisobutyrate dehydrogenase-like beta-hydroxyacid dehydrogenase